MFHFKKTYWLLAVGFFLLINFIILSLKSLDMILFWLLKFGQRKHIEDLYNNGTIYMNSINYFKRVEQNEQKKDDREGILHIKQISWLQLKIDDKIIEFSKTGTGNLITSAQYREEATELLGNIFSTYAITDELVSKTDIIDKRCAGLGDTILIITKPITFLKRVQQALESKNIEYKCDFVKYYDEHSYEGDLGFFYKPNHYTHQSEYRICIMNDKDEPYILTIGSIADISQICDISALENIRFGTREQLPKAYFD